MALPLRVKERLAIGLKRMVPILIQQRARDVSEADTVTLVKDLLSDVFGYDKYADLTSEFCIRGTYCDLAVKIDEKVSLLVEVKAIGSDLDDRHVKQAVDYAANQGIEWVVLTNAIRWRFYHVVFSKPIDKKLIAELDLTSIDPRKEQQLESLFLLTKEGMRKGAHIELRDRQDATSRFIIAALLVSNQNISAAIRRELRRVVDVLVTDNEISTVLKNEVVKRDTLEGPLAEQALKKITRTEGRLLRQDAKASNAVPTIPDIVGPGADSDKPSEQDE